MIGRIIAMNVSDARLLQEARSKAEKLLARLLEQQAQLGAHPPKISPADLAMGENALQNAIASAHRALAALADAEQTGLEEPDDDNTGRPS